MDLDENIVREIVNHQIEVVKENLDIKDYGILEKSLAEGLRKYFLPELRTNGEVDENLLVNLAVGGYKNVANKLISAVEKRYNKNNLNDSDFLDFYNFQNEHFKQKGFYSGSCYGPKTQRLLEMYLAKKSLIEENNNS